MSNTKHVTAMLVMFQDPVERLEYYIAHRNERERQIFETLSQQPGKKMSAMDIVKIVYKVI